MVSGQATLCCSDCRYFCALCLSSASGPFNPLPFPVSAAVSKAAAALLGDLASSVSGVGVLFQQKPYVTAFLQQCSQDRSMAETAKWAAQMVQKAMHSG